jgi:hypothetical protein
LRSRYQAVDDKSHLDPILAEAGCRDFLQAGVPA